MSGATQTALLLKTDNNVPGKLSVSEEKVKTQRGQVTKPGVLSWEAPELGFDPKSMHPKVCLIIHHQHYNVPQGQKGTEGRRKEKELGRDRQSHSQELETSTPLPATGNSAGRIRMTAQHSRSPGSNGAFRTPHPTTQEPQTLKCSLEHSQRQAMNFKECKSYRVSSPQGESQ